MFRSVLCVLSVELENKINQLSLRSPSRVPYRKELRHRAEYCAPKGRLTRTPHGTLPSQEPVHLGHKLGGF
jgi:hypothetical protein